MLQASRRRRRPQGVAFAAAPSAHKYDASHFATLWVEQACSRLCAAPERYSRKERPGSAKGQGQHSGVPPLEVKGGKLCVHTSSHIYGLLHVSWSRRNRGAEAIPGILSSPALKVRGQRKAVGIPSGVGGNPKYSVGCHTGTIHEEAPPWEQNKPTNLTQTHVSNSKRWRRYGSPPPRCWELAGSYQP